MASFLGDFLGECRACSTREGFFLELDVADCVCFLGKETRSFDFLGERGRRSSFGGGDARPRLSIFFNSGVLGDVNTSEVSPFELIPFLGVFSTGATTGLILTLMPVLVSRTKTCKRLYELLKICSVHAVDVGIFASSFIFSFLVVEIRVSVLLLL